MGDWGHEQEQRTQHARASTVGGARAHILARAHALWARAAREPGVMTGPKCWAHATKEKDVTEAVAR